MATADIFIKGHDQTSPAAKSARDSLSSLNREVKGVSQAFSQAGRFAAAFGNEQIANLTVRASILTSTFKTASEVLNKVGLARAGIVGVAIAMAGFVFQRAMAEKQRLAEQLKEEAEAQKELEKSIKATAAAQADLNEKIKSGEIGKGGALQKALNEKSLTQGARQAGVVIGDPINSPTDAAKAVKALADAEAKAAKQRADAQKLVAEQNDKNWELYEAILEEQKKKEKEVSDAKIAAEEKAWEIYDAIMEDKKLREEELARTKVENDRIAAESAKAAAEEARLAWERANFGLIEQMKAAEEMANHSILNIGQALRSFSASFALSISDGIGNMAAAIATGAMTAKEALKQLGREMIGMLAKAATQLVVNAALAVALQSSFVAASALAATSVASAWATAAALVSLASYGANAIPAAAGIVATTTLAKSLAIVGGQAHSGMDYVPREASYTLQRGEMVLDPGTSEEVREAASGRASGGGRGGDLYIDGEKIGRVLWNMSRNGRLRIAGGAVV